MSEEPSTQRDEGSRPLSEIVPLAFSAFSAEEVKRLRLYSKAVATLKSWELADRYQDLTITVGEGKDRLDGASRTEIVAFMTAFRKVMLLNEPAMFNQIRGDLRRHAREAGTQEGELMLQWLGFLRQHRADSLAKGPVFAYVLEHRDGQHEEVTPMDALDLVINAEVFHTDNEKLERWERLGGWDNTMLVFLIVTTMVGLVPAVTAVNRVVEAILATPELLAA